MSFTKGADLLQLATMAAARREGVTIEVVQRTFAVSWRTAQRMLRALERQFGETTTEIGEDRRWRWKLPQEAVRGLLSLEAEELAALDLAVEALQRQGQGASVDTLSSLREKILALTQRGRGPHLEPDHEALLEAQGVAVRPGPRPFNDPKVTKTVTEAIKAGRCLKVLFRRHGQPRAKWITLAPLGILIGLRRYLVAIFPGEEGARARLHRFEGIRKAELSEESFGRPAGFDLHRFARRSFGMYQDEREYGEVVWRFLPKAAAAARDFEFHPDQVQERRKDGSLVVRFKAAGHLEMCWYLYAWGDGVEVLAPEALRRRCESYRRSDFESTP
jgi:predicted DNA-binding transcriptional regulator YafY